MKEAEKVRAEILADGTLAIADDEKRSAAAAANAIRARQWLAERLDRKRYGKESTVRQEIRGQIQHQHVHQLTDEQLMAIAAGDVIEGELAGPETNDPARSATPAPPRVAATPPSHFRPADEEC